MKMPSHPAIRSRAARVVLGLPAVPLALAACGGETPHYESAALPPVTVEVAPLTRGGGQAIHPGRVVAAREVDVSTRMAGTLLEVAPLGEAVRAGQVVARLDEVDLRAALSRAEAAARLADRTLERIRSLHGQGAAAQQELDEAEARASQAAATVESARAQLSYTTLQAPVSGRVVARPMQAGDLATPGRTVLRIASSGREVHMELPAELRDAVPVGTELGLADGGEDLRVLRVSDALDARTRRFTVELGAPVELELGAIVRVAVPIEGAEAALPVVPETAIVRRGQLTGVFTVVADTLRLRWVRLGRESDGGFELLAGPGEGLTEVVVTGVAGLHDGAPVASVTRSSPTPVANPTDDGGLDR